MSEANEVKAVLGVAQHLVSQTESQLRGVKEQLQRSLDILVLVGGSHGAMLDDAATLRNMISKIDEMIPLGRQTTYGIETYSNGL